MARIVSFLPYFIFLLTDPSFSQDTLILQPGPEGKDALVSSRYTHGFGNYPNLFALGWTASGDPFTTRTLMDFNLETLPPESIILAAKLSLYYATNTSNPGLVQTENNQAFLLKITQPWHEHEVTWWTQPPTSDQYSVRLPASVKPYQDYTCIDITAMIMDRYLHPDHNFGIMLQLENESPYHAMCFASSDFENQNLRPKLEIIYKICPPPSVSFSYAIDDQLVSFEAIAQTAFSWLWDFGDGYLSVLQNPVHHYQEQGKYEVCLQVEDSCGSARYCEMVDVCDMPSAGFDFQAEGLTVYFEDTCQHTLSYFWSFGDGYFSNLGNPWHVYDNTGIYEACLFAFNECGSDTVCREVNVTPSLIGSPDLEGIGVYPNPASDLIRLKIPGSNSVSLDLTSLQGNIVLSSELIPLDGEIELSIPREIRTGIYILKVDGKTWMGLQKIIIIK